MTGAAPTTVTVAVLTFRRPDDIAQVLPALAEQLAQVPADRYDVEVLVVDNDPVGSARGIVTAHAGVRYVVEAAAGIAHARNRALDEAADRDVVVFLDDDERPHPGWLATLLETRRSTGAVAVAGRVVSSFPGGLDPWIAAGGFFERRSLPTGTAIDVAATNNLALDTAVLRDLGLRFDPDFGRTGGEDSLLTRRLAASGAVLVWCDEAVVTDVVPPDRTTRRWVLDRSRLYGVTAVRVQLALSVGRRQRVRTRVAVLVRAAAPRIAGGLLRWVAGVLLRSPTHRARGLRTAVRGVGMVQGASGYRREQYGAP